MLYEVIREDINPCGGEEYAARKFLEVETDDPVSWVRENGQHPLLETVRSASGDLMLITGNGHGYFTRYTFTE